MSEDKTAQVGTKEVPLDKDKLLIPDLTHATLEKIMAFHFGEQAQSDSVRDYRTRMKEVVLGELENDMEILVSSGVVRSPEQARDFLLGFRKGVKTALEINTNQNVRLTIDEVDSIIKEGKGLPELAREAFLKGLVVADFGPKAKGFLTIILEEPDWFSPLWKILETKGGTETKINNFANGLRETAKRFAEESPENSALIGWTRDKYPGLLQHQTASIK